MPQKPQPKIICFLFAVRTIFYTLEAVIVRSPASAGYQRSPGQNNKGHGPWVITRGLPRKFAKKSDWLPDSQVDWPERVPQGSVAKPGQAQGPYAPPHLVHHGKDPVYPLLRSVLFFWELHGVALPRSGSMRSASAAALGLWLSLALAGPPGH